MNRFFLLAFACLFTQPVFSKTFYFQNDTVPPVVVCPANDTVIIAPGPCTAPYLYTVAATDDLPGVTLTQTAGLPSGDDFPLGNTVNSFTATDAAGNTSTCSFRVRIVHEAYSFDCPEYLEIQLSPDSCSFTAAPSLMLDSAYNGCPTAYEFYIYPVVSGPIHPLIFTSMDLGKRFDIFMTDTLAINYPSCVTRIKILAPTPVISCTDLHWPCVLSYDQHDPEYLFDSLGLINAFPQVLDLCGGTSQLSRVDQYLPGGCDDGLYELLMRTWKATGANGQTATCIQHIEIIKVELTQVVIPADIVHPFPCKQTWQAWSLESVPFFEFQGKKFPLTNNNDCNISTQFTDEVQTLCPGKRQVNRRFEVLDACTDSILVDTQIILLPENTAPKVHCDSFRVVQTNASNCTITLQWLPVPVSETCSYTDGISVWWLDGPDTIRLQATIFNGGPLQPDTTGLFDEHFPFPVGETLVTYEATDACGNIGTCKQTIAVWDNAPPILNCGGNGTTVYLSGSGYQELIAADWVQSASDNCGDVTYKIRREVADCGSSSSWNDVTYVCCADIGDSVAFVVRAYDLPLPVGEIQEGFGQGQYTSCQISIVVADTASLQCNAPGDTVVTCLDPDLDVYGIFTQSCSTANMIWENDFSDFDSLCKNGIVRRSVTVSAFGGLEKNCSQTITVTGKASNLAIRFPDDYYVTNCVQLGTPMNFGEPLIRTEGCSNIEVKMVEQVYPGTTGFCSKIERTWTIRDRCLSPMGNELLRFVPNPMPHSSFNHPLNMPGPVVSASGSPSSWDPTIVKISPNSPNQTSFHVFWSDSTAGYTYKQQIWLDDDSNEPVYEDWPTNTVFVPDSTSNQTEFWNDSLIVVPSRNLPADRPEAPIILTARASDKCGFLTADVYLHLDLTGNSGRESLVSNKQSSLPRGKMHINNQSIFTINSGPLISFDKRPVPDNEKYRFVVKTFLVDSAAYIWEARLYWEGANGELVPPQLPHGYHRAEWIFKNRCNKTLPGNYNFSVRDGMPPVLDCVDSLFLSLDANGQAQINYDDVLLSTAVDNLTPDDRVEISLNKNVITNFPLDVSGNPVSLLEYNCWSPTFQKGQLWAVDTAGNAGSCTFFLKVQDTEGVCNFGPVTLGGRLYTTTGQPIPDAPVYFDPQQPLIDASDTANNAGIYDHYFNISGVRFNIKPSRNHDPINGVTTFDLVLINKHILDIETLDSPYKIIAADANGNRSVTTADIAVLRRLILGVQDTLPGQLSWRFVDSAYVFSNPQHPFAPPFAFNKSVYNPPGDQLWHHLIGVKIGDVNETAIVNVLQTTLNDRAVLPLVVDEQNLRQGEIVDIHLAPQSDLLASQFTLEFAGLEVLEIKPDAPLTTDHVVFFGEKNMLTFSNDAGKKTGLNLKLRALENGFLSEKIKLSDAITPAESWTANSERQLPQLVFRKNENAAYLAARPNVFTDQTVMHYHLPSDTQAELLVYNAAGQLLFQQTVPGTAGEHQFVLTASMLNNATGPLAVQLRAGETILATKVVRQ